MATFDGSEVGSGQAACQPVRAPARLHKEPEGSEGTRARDLHDTSKGEELAGPLHESGSSDV